MVQNNDEKCEKHTLELLTLKKEQEEQARSIARHKAESLAVGLKLDDHVKSSIDRVEKMVKHDSQIITLEKANVAIMEDLKCIKDDIKEINTAISNIELAQIKGNNEVKIWILTGMLTGVLALSGTAIYGLIEMGGIKKQVEINTKKWEMLDGGHYDRNQRSPLGN